MTQDEPPHPLGDPTPTTSSPSNASGVPRPTPGNSMPLPSFSAAERSGTPPARSKHHRAALTATTRTRRPEPGPRTPSHLTSEDTGGFAASNPGCDNPFVGYRNRRHRDKHISSRLPRPQRKPKPPAH